jgi:uncharacterized protein (TIGR03437 family)
MYAAIAALPVVLLAFSMGPPPRRTGAAVDGGLACNACHGGPANAPNSDPRGSLAITFDAPSYAPGVPLVVHVRLAHTEQARWGFQLTARLASDLTRAVGSFTPTTDIRVLCDNNRDAPCDGALEFAAHRAAPRTPPGAGFTFDVPWTPPATDVGDLVFFAAGNAADGNGIPGAGDRIYTTVRTLSAPCLVSARPTLREVTDAASYRTPWSANSLLTLFGTGFAGAGKSREVRGFDLGAQQLFPRELACVAVEFGGTRVPVIYVDPNQINVQAPTLTRTSGPVPVAVILNPGRSNEVRSEVLNNGALQDLSPALFTLDGRIAAAQVGNTLVTAAQPARPGDAVSLFGTGFGYTQPVWQAGEVPVGLAPLSNPVAVSIGGVTLAASEVNYAGLAAGSISGLYQINARIPANAQDGNLPVVVTVGGVASQSGVTIPVRR